MLVTQGGQTNLSRRRLVGTSVGLLGGLAAGTAVASQAGTPESSPGAGWSYTDVLGTTVELDGPPVRIAANLVTAAALWDLGIRPVAVFDWTASAYPDGDHIAWGNVDPEAVANIGDVDGNILPEELLLVEPDIIFTLTYENGNPDETASVPPDMAETINAIAPVLVVTDMGPTDIQLERLVALAESLGADLGAPEIVAARDAYAAKVEEFRETATASADISTLFANFDTGTFWVGGPQGVAELQFLQGLGLNFVNAEAPTAGDFWEELSAEQALKYPADIIYADVYSALLTAEDLQASPVYGAMPAVAAGQVGLWKRDFPVNYAGIADFLETILVTLRDAEPVS